MKGSRIERRRRSHRKEKECQECVIVTSMLVRKQKGYMTGKRRTISQFKIGYPGLRDFLIFSLVNVAREIIAIEGNPMVPPRMEKHCTRPNTT